MSPSLGPGRRSARQSMIATIMLPKNYRNPSQSVMVSEDAA